MFKSMIGVQNCKNCVHYRPYWMISHIDHELSDCAIFGRKESPNSKFFIYNYLADECRKDESLCGKNGSFFKQNLKRDKYFD